MENEYIIAFTIQPGLEEILNNEFILRCEQLSQLNQDPYYSSLIKEIRMDKGFIEVRIKSQYIHTVIQNIKSPTKVLLRFHHFTARDFPKYFKEISEFNWSKLIKSNLFEYSVSTTKSRLIHSEKIKIKTKEAIEFYFKNHPLQKKGQTKNTNKLHVHFDNDKCTLSFDIGQHLDKSPFYFRKLKLVNSKASLRENLAFVLYFVAISNLNNKFLNELRIIDPFAGSGTILLESLDKVPNENYMFENLKHNFPKLKKQVLHNIQRPHLLIANDNDKEMKSALTTNLAILNNLDIPYIIKNEDFENLDIDLEEENNLILISNIPYNKRISINLKRLIEQIDHFIKKYQIKKSVILGPRDTQSAFVEKGFNIQYQFRNGGYPVNIYVR